jgi:phage anti-repressor protein
MKILIESKSINNFILPTGKNANKYNFYFISPDNLKVLLIISKSDKANKCREYFIMIEKLFKIYIRYQLAFQTNLLNIK